MACDAKKQLGKQGLFRLKNRQRRNLIAIYRYLMGGSHGVHREDEAKLLLEI